MPKQITKVVLKTMAITLVSVFGVVILLFLFLSLTAPAAMARLTRDVGMLKTSAWYSYLQYDEGQGDIEHIELAMNCCILINHEEGVVKYGEIFVEDERFAAYSEQIEQAEAGMYREVYTQYVYGRIGVGYYRLGEKAEALQFTLSAIEQTFDEYNAVTDLINETILKNDTEFGEDILLELEELYAENDFSLEENGYLLDNINNLKVFTD